MEPDGDSVLHNAVGYARWCEERAQHAESTLERARREGRGLTPEECKDLVATLPEMLRRSGELAVFNGVMFARVRAPWWRVLGRWAWARIRGRNKK